MSYRTYVVKTYSALFCSTSQHRLKESMPRSNHWSEVNRKCVVLLWSLNSTPQSQVRESDTPGQCLFTQLSIVDIEVQLKIRQLHPKKMAANRFFFVHQVSTMRRLLIRTVLFLFLTRTLSHPTRTDSPPHSNSLPLSKGWSQSQSRSPTTSPSKTAANGSFFVHQVSTMRRLLIRTLFPHSNWLSSLKLPPPLSL